MSPRTYPTLGGQRIHRIRAEHALGKPLPAHAHVHHADGTKRADGPLVICESLAYHRLLHQRMRVVQAGGNPNTDAVCSRCGLAKPMSQFAPTGRSKGCDHLCYPCAAIVKSLWYTRHRDRITAQRRAQYAARTGD